MPLQGWQIVPTLAEFGDFDSVDGGELQIQHTDYIAAGQRSPQKLDGTHTYSPLTLTRAFDPIRDRQVMDWFFRVKEGLDGPRSLILKYLNQQRVVIDTRTYPVAKAASLQTPAGRSGDSAVAEFRITLEVEDLT